MDQIDLVDWRVKVEAYHHGQMRKWSGVPYFTHCLEVRDIVKEVIDDLVAESFVHESIILGTAIGHDVIEDTDISREEIEAFSPILYAGIWTLSKPKIGTRKQRAEHALANLRGAIGWLQSIKCADIISNVPSIRQNEPKFWNEVYEAEKIAQLRAMHRAHPKLWCRAIRVCVED